MSIISKKIEIDPKAKKRKKVTEERKSETVQKQDNTSEGIDEIKFTGKFDLSDSENLDELYKPSPAKHKRNKRGDTEYNFVSVYMPADEQEHLAKLAEKYHMSKSALIRELLMNAK